MLTIQRPSTGLSVLKSGTDLVVAGYASVELVDKQGDLITRGALKDAFDGFMKSDRYRNVQLAHSNIQVGEVIDSYVDSNGRMWKSEVDDTGMFVVCKLRNDIEKAREVAAEIRKGNLQGFSIGGQAFKRVRKADGEKADGEHGEYQEISKMELHEITICEKGINPEAQFRILKEDVSKMTDIDNDLNAVMNRLEARLDAMEKGEIPPQLREHIKGKKDDSDDKKEEMKDDKMKAEEEMKDKKKDEDKDDKMYKGNEYSDVISAEYLNWMEDTLKSAGVDTAGARAHFDALEKAQLGGFDNPDAVDGADYFAGQVRGRGQTAGSPSTGAISAVSQSGGKQPAGAMGAAELSKSYINPNEVSSSDIEAAYEVYKAAAMEQQFRGDLEGHFASRFANEQAVAKSEAEKAQFDAREPISEVMKALEGLSERIDNLTTEGTTIAKADTSTNVSVPSTQDLNNMSWDEVHSLANSVYRRT